MSDSTVYLTPQVAHYRHTGWITFCICCRDLTEGQWEGTQDYSTYIVISGLHKSTPTSFQSSQQFPLWKTTSLLQRTCRSLKYRRCILYDSNYIVICIGLLNPSWNLCQRLEGPLFSLSLFASYIIPEGVRFVLRPV